MLTCIVGKNVIDAFTYKEEKLREWSNKGMLKCPVCGEDMVYCHGDYKIPYFRHVQNSDCPDIYSEGITEEHILGVKALYDWLNNQSDITDVQLEKWMPETRQRPDIYFKYNDGEYVIEYQCSPIATKYNERHELYRLNNINDIWILGMQKYNVSSILNTKSIEREIYYTCNRIIYLNPFEGKGMFYKTDEGGLKYRTNYYNYYTESILKTKFDVNLMKLEVDKLNINFFNETKLMGGNVNKVINTCFKRIEKLKLTTHSNYTLYLNNYKKDKYIILKSDRCNGYIFKIKISEFNEELLEKELSGEINYANDILKFLNVKQRFNFGTIKASLCNYIGNDISVDFIFNNNQRVANCVFNFNDKLFDSMNITQYLYKCGTNNSLINVIEEYVDNKLYDEILRDSQYIFNIATNILEKRLNINPIRGHYGEYKFKYKVNVEWNLIKITFGIKTDKVIFIKNNEIAFNYKTISFKNYEDLKVILDNLISNELRIERYPNTDR